MEPRISMVSVLFLAKMTSMYAAATYEYRCPCAAAYEINRGCEGSPSSQSNFSVCMAVRPSLEGLALSGNTRVPGATKTR
ncbi:hypothetical protein DFH07DRAFT_154049 [Mycena maculata]|uniref:Secreted protein n=1 Tax=Mycena maculata TaxID=230809 RepID=A0AAD7HY88_9AGAR|nr:hypothetical protein DFH07DRAFT_154049 [Mycena maculata]